ncbi:hypothetical protein ACW2AB_03075 [Limosilactobacillus fermentum]
MGQLPLVSPLGDSGARILVTLLYQMKRQNAKRGLGPCALAAGSALPPSSTVRRIVCVNYSNSLMPP